MTARQRLERVDGFQQRHRPLGIAAATLKKYAEDRSSNLAALIAFWAFFSLFPLFLVFVTVLGYVLPADERVNVLRHAAAFFPLIDTGTLHSLTGSWWPVLLGAVTALWSGTAVTRTTEQALNDVWEIPREDRPGLVERLRRSLLALSTIGLGLVVSTIVSGYVTGRAVGVDLGALGRGIGYAVAILLDVGLFLFAFRLLTARAVGFRDVLPGALLSGVVFWVLQELSAFVVSRRLQSAQSTYGNFATVITILWWFYLQGQVTMFGAQLNVVLKEGLHPRSLVGGPRAD